MKSMHSWRFLFSRLNQAWKQIRKRKKLESWLVLEKQRISAIKLTDEVPPRQGTLIIKCDDIGDFLIWQQCIPFFKDKLEGPLYFVGNKVVKELYDTWFDFADHCIWVDKARWSDPSYRMEIYNSVRMLHVKLALEPMFTRNYEMDDMILWASAAETRIAWQSALHTYYPSLRAVDGLANVERATSNPIALEYFRNYEFFSAIIQEPTPTEFNIQFPTFGKQNRLIVLPVGSIASKSWPKEHYVQLLRQVLPLFDSVLLLGGANAKAASDYIEKETGSPKVMNLAGQTRLTDMIPFIGESQMLLSPDTFGVHVAAMTGTPMVVISNGHQWQRFLNYGPHLKSGVKIVFPPYFKPEPNQYKTWHTRSEIAQVRVADVVKAIKELKRGASTGERQI